MQSRRELGGGRGAEKALAVAHFGRFGTEKSFSDSGSTMAADRVLE